jgi:hypothetical protein
MFQPSYLAVPMGSPAADQRDFKGMDYMLPAHYCRVVSRSIWTENFTNWSNSGVFR